MAVREGRARLCETCKHLVSFYNCGRKLRYVSNVDGEEKYKSCNLERDGLNFFWWRCGPRGRFWEFDEEGNNHRARFKKRMEELDNTLDNIKRLRKKK